MVLLGANIFVPTAPDLHRSTTGIAIDARIWNLGRPSRVTDWKLVVISQGSKPILAQYTEIPDQLRLGGGTNSSILRAADDLSKKVLDADVTAVPVQGAVLFYITLLKSSVMNDDTVLELSFVDVFGTETVARHRTGDWMHR